MNALRRQWTRVLLVMLGLVLAGCAGISGGTSRESGMVPASGSQLYYEAAGAGEPVVFIHGFTLDTRMWDDQFDEFAKRYRVIRYDARGFGRSGGVTSPFSIRDDLRALLDHLGIKQAHLVGLSMGGRYAIDFTLTHPDRVRSLVAVDAALGGFPTPNLGKEIGAAIAAGKKGDLAQAKRIWLGVSLFTPAAEQPAVAAKLKRIVDDYNGWHFVNGPGMHELALNPPAATRLGEIRKPTLVIIGSREVPELIAAADKITNEVAGARKAVIPNVGHMSNMEAPPAFNKILADFLATVK